MRGWITAFAGRDDGEDEWEMDVLVDVGWSNSSSATPLNTIQSASNFLTPNNIVGLGQQNVSAIHPSTLGPEASVDGTEPPYWALQNPGALNAWTAWGGTGGPVIHIEVDGWGVYRACNIDSAHQPCAARRSAVAPRARVGLPLLPEATQRRPRDVLSGGRRGREARADCHHPHSARAPVGARITARWL